ncbi:hypothetical protein [Flavobacterium phycosphaerae]|uniref:hypothetical protein n=1 Tax=Flavobacterium phycosphaerae TaxID=2697515 RepID=UPI001389786D|nr:hypothetical protein [Flavobacterium phycosphaerae]
MNYSVQNLTQVADCNVLLTWAEREKADLAFKKTAEERLIVKYAETSIEIDAVLQGVITELAVTDGIIASLPDGPVKDEQLKKRKKIDYKKFLLETRRETYGVIALLQKELDVTRLDRELAEIDVFIETVKTYKENLLAATPAA